MTLNITFSVPTLWSCGRSSLLPHGTYPMDEGVLVKKKSTTRLRVVSFQFDVAGLIRGIFYSIHGVESSKNSHIQYITYFTMYSPLQWLSLCRHHKSLATLWTRLKYMEGEIKVRRIGERAAPHGVALCRIG